MPATLPPAANKHTMRIEWIDADKLDVRRRPNGRPVLTPNVHANGPGTTGYSTEIGPTAATKLARHPGRAHLQERQGQADLRPGRAGKAPEEKLKVPIGKARAHRLQGSAFPDGTKVDVTSLVMEPPKHVHRQRRRNELQGAPVRTIRSSIRWQGATAVTHKFDGWDITIFDDSADGKFDAYGDDSVMISKGKVVRSVPLSRYVYLGDLLFEMKLDPSGQNMRFKPYDGPIALLQFDYVGKTRCRRS